MGHSGKSKAVEGFDCTEKCSFWEWSTSRSRDVRKATAGMNDFFFASTALAIDTIGTEGENGIP